MCSITHVKAGMHEAGVRRCTTCVFRHVCVCAYGILVALVCIFYGQRAKCCIFWVYSNFYACIRMYIIECMLQALFINKQGLMLFWCMHVAPTAFRHLEK
jgi:hypothetical protein